MWEVPSCREHSIHRLDATLLQCIVEFWERAGYFRYLVVMSYIIYYHTFLDSYYVG